MCLATSSNLLLVLKDAPKQNISVKLWSSGQPKNDAKKLFSTLHPLSLVIFATATVVAFVLLHNSRFNFHCYTQHEAMPTQKVSRKWRCNHSRLLAQKITKSIHLCKPSSLNGPIVCRFPLHRVRWGPADARHWVLFWCLPYHFIEFPLLLSFLVLALTLHSVSLAAWHNQCTRPQKTIHHPHE